MSKIQIMRLLVNQRLTAAAEEIFELFERTIAEYEEQLRGSKEEQLKLLDSVYNPEVQLHRADFHQLSVNKEEVPPEQQERRPSLDLEDPPEPAHIKEEQEELWSSQEGDQLQGLEEADFSALMFTHVPVKSDEDGEKPQSSQLHENQTSKRLLSSESDTDDSSFDCDIMKSHKESERGVKYRTRETFSSPDHATSSAAEGLKHNGSESSQKPFSCLICKKTFPFRGDVQRHMITHTGERPFKCSICGSRFTRSQTLNTHLRLHTGEKPFSCSVCGTSFSRRHSLDIHMRTHTGEKPFSCSVCGKKFPTRRNLKRHSVIHTGEKRYGCSLCGQTFALPGTLKRHLTVHTGEKPFRCLVCGKEFTRQFCLTRHFAVHKKEAA
ncbi:zinc finger protein OZF-like [Notolabrus celidotus]|uniref:zinc finger protein OZF-like n=1 Tax=Notolabrus celidotus TaxID=1203425 RepID=UPI00148FD3CB|nr:zinc finger protein OZF-like [Notolabrus celidotus]